MLCWILCGLGSVQTNIFKGIIDVTWQSRVLVNLHLESILLYCKSVDYYFFFVTQDVKRQSSYGTGSNCK